MQLGNILSTAAHPVVPRVVSFNVLGSGAGGEQVQARAEAIFVFVDEDLREQSKKLAREYLEQEYGEKPFPRDVLVEEEYRWFLMVALHDKDAPSRQFCLNSEYGKFRKALIMEQVSTLKAKYDAFVRDEYPELLSEDEQKKLAEAASKNS